MAAKNERRRKERKRPSSLVYVELATGNGGMMRDLSEEGFATRAMMPLRTGEKTPFRFSLDESTNITGEGHICWVKDDGKLAGVRFEEIAPTALDQIREWLRKGGRLTKEQAKPARGPEPATPTLQDFREQLQSIPSHPPAAKKRISPPAPVTTNAPVIPVSATPPAKTESILATPVTSSPPVSSERNIETAGHPAPRTHEVSAEAAPVAPLPPVDPKRSAIAPAVFSPAPKTESVPDMPAIPAPPLSSQSSVVAEAHPPLATQTESHAAPPAVSTPSTPVRSENNVMVPAVPSPEAQTESVPTTPAVPVPALPTESVWEKLMLPSSPVSSESVTAAPAIPASQEKKEVAPALPDISTILLQPTITRKSSEPIELPPEVPALEPLPSPEEERPAKRGPRMERFTIAKAVGIMLVLALLVSVYVYHRNVGLVLIWVGQKIAGMDQPGDRTATMVEKQASSSAPARQPETTAATTNQADTTFPNSPSSPVNQEPKNATAGESSENMPQVSSNQANRNSLLLVTPLTGSTRAAPGAPTDQEIGQTEYQQALQLLRGKNREANMQEAVRLLWASVEKGNPGAELTLAELFWRGQGVTKSCDQARILLSAAARKGNAEARDRLKQFQQEGCE